MRDDVIIGDADDGDIEAVVRLWERCDLTRPWNDPQADLAHARGSPASAVLVARAEGELIASVMVGYDGHRGWVYYLAVAPEARRRGMGRRMMQAAEAWLREREAPKIQLMVRATNAAVIGFYERLGLERQDVVTLGKRLDQMI
jgi:ribosomal protein S18 acetylase RimI-like enzyme